MQRLIFKSLFGRLGSRCFLLTNPKKKLIVCAKKKIQTEHVFSIVCGKRGDVNRLYNTFAKLECRICACSSSSSSSIRLKANNNGTQQATDTHSLILRRSNPIVCAAFVLQGNYNAVCPYNNCTALMNYTIFAFSLSLSLCGHSFPFSSVSFHIVYVLSPCLSLSFYRFFSLSFARTHSFLFLASSPEYTILLLLGVCNKKKELVAQI